MAKINRYLKNIFTGINILVAIAAGLVVILNGKFNLWMNPNKDMDIIFTENRFFKEDILLSEDFLFARAIVCLCGAGLLVISCLGTYGVRKKTVWPLAVFITASSIGMITFLMQGVRVTKLRNVIITYMSETGRENFLTIEEAMPVSFALAAIEFIRIVLAIVIIGQLQTHQAAIPPSASGDTKAMADSELSHVCQTNSATEFNSKDTQKLLNVL